MMLKMITYLDYVNSIPSKGKQVLAQYTEDTVIVYQAYHPSIAKFAIQHGYFGGNHFSYSRMSWIKTHFLWMMYRSGWGTKVNQEMTLAIHLKREAFDTILSQAVISKYDPKLFDTVSVYQQALKQSEVRLQWDPDHDPYGAKCERKAIQLGLRGSILECFGKEWIVRIEDLTDFVREQREHVCKHRLDLLQVPKEEVYPIDNLEIAKTLGLL